MRRRVPYIPNGDAYRAHYGAGSGIGDVFKGDAYQDGYGLGGVLASLFRKAMPILTTAAKTVGKNLLRSGANVVSDIVSGKQDLGSSLKRRGIESLQNVVKDVIGQNQR